MRHLKLSELGEGKLLSVSEAATDLCVSYKTLYRWIKEDNFPAIRINGVIRIKRAAMQDWLDARACRV